MVEMIVSRIKCVDMIFRSNVFGKNFRWKLMFRVYACYEMFEMLPKTVISGRKTEAAFRRCY